MAGPKRQHFIPRSYLKKFSNTTEDDKAFVEVMNVKSGEIIYPFSIKNLCVAKNIYTIPKAEDKDKYALEHYYAENVDALFPEVHRLLTDEDIVEISEEDRQKILSTTLSLYFRTSKFLDERNTELEDVFAFITRTQEKFKDADKEMNLYFGDRNYTFRISQAEEVKEQIKINAKLDFIVGHFTDWQNFVRHKYHSQITVHKVTKEFPLISCDNPVQIYNTKGTSKEIFDPNNSIQLPLDDQHLLWLSPNTQKSERNIIYRGLRDKWFAFTSNHTSQANATDWIIGKENTLAEHLRQQKTYTDEHPEGKEAIESIENRYRGLVEFISIVEKCGLGSEEAIQKFRLLRQNPHFQNDPQFQIMSKEMEGKGYV